MRALKTLSIFLFVATCALSQQHDNRIEHSRAVLSTDGSWSYFSWSSGPGVFNDGGPITFSTSQGGTLDVTDFLIAGDRFQVLNNGSAIGSTSTPTGTGSHTNDPNQGFNSPAWSSGSFSLGPGNHAITIFVQSTPTGYPDGTGAIRFSELPSDLCSVNPDACAVDTTEVAYDTSRRYPGCTGTVGCNAAVRLNFSRGPVNLPVSFSGIGQPTAFALPSAGESRVRMAWTDLDMFGSSPMGPVHARINQEPSKQARSTVTLHSLSPDGAPFFPAVLTNVYFFEFEFTDTGVVAFNEDPVVMRSTEPIFSYPPIGIPYVQLDPVDFFDRADPTGQPLFTLESVTVTAHGEDQEIPLTLEIAEATADQIQLRAEFRNSTGETNSFFFVGEGTPGAFRDALVLSPSSLAGPGAENHMVSGEVTLGINESVEIVFRFAPTEDRLEEDDQFDFFVIVPHQPIYGETTVQPANLFQDGFESGDLSEWSQSS